VSVTGGSVAGDGARPATGSALSGSRFVTRPTPLRESVYEALAEMIISRQLQPGQHLVELELAEVLGVSRQPVREALQRLHTEGWVDLEPGYGAFVHVPTEDEADQLLTARTILESESARLAATHVTDESVETLRRLCQDGVDAIEADDIEAFVRANSAFHAAVTDLSGNRVLSDFASQVDRRVRWYYQPVAAQRGREACTEHTAVIDAIAAGDRETAAQVMREHTERTRQAYHQTREAKGEHDESSGPRVHRRRSRRRSNG
jgi:DNA-binding GntR family transcriptional regulator